jgi:phosphatidylinositol alpha-1,6-mannosyltransferase
MRLLLTGYRFDTIGGLEIVSANLARILAEQGHEVRCAAVHGRADVARDGYSVAGLMPQARLWRALAARFPAFYPKRRLRSLIAWADAIIACHCHTLPLVRRAMPAGGRRPPVVAWLHGREVWGRFGDEHAESLRQCDRLVAVSQCTSDTVARLLGPEHRPLVVHNSIDTEFFRPAERPDDIRRLSVLTVGRHDIGTEHKGYDMLLAAVARLRQAAAPLPLALTIVGDGPRLTILRAEAARLGIADAVEFPGAVSRTELRRRYATCDLFAFPSRVNEVGDAVYGEGFGVVNIEAAACGRPVLTSTHGGCPETILDGVTGVLVDPTDVAAVAAGLERVFRLSPEDRDRMGRRGRERAEVSFSHAALADRLAGLVATLPRLPVALHAV